MLSINKTIEKSERAIGRKGLHSRSYGRILAYDCTIRRIDNGDNG